MLRYSILTSVLVLAMSTQMVFAMGPSETVVQAEQVLSEFMAIPVKQIPHRLLDEAQGIAIIPNVIKIGFVAGARRGHGVVMVRDADGEWSLPQFITLTGGSVGWQAGIQGTDVVLVFTTRKSVDGLMRGRFTVGVDASASAGPVGREAAASTDPTLRSEILSYSRSRGLFVGVSLDGTALEIDHDAHAMFYGTPSDEIPRRQPSSATELRHFLAELTPKHVPTATSEERPMPVVSFRLIEALRRSLNRSSDQLQGVLSPEWRPYLAMPKELHEPGTYPSAESLALVLRRFNHVNNSAEYLTLSQRPEFQNTFEFLKEYEHAVSSSRPTLKLPPPPRHRE